MNHGLKQCAIWALLSASAFAQDAATQREARERWFLRGHISAAHSVARSRALRPRAQGITASVGTADGWTPVGPLPLTSDPNNSGQANYVAGRVTSVAIDPNDLTGNTVYVGGAFGGVWKSTNAATPVAADVTWKALTDDQDTLAIGAIAVQPAGTVVLAGTGETNSSIDSYYGLGILRSPDSGKTWTLIPQDQAGHSFAGMGFSKIVFDSDAPNFVVAATAGTSQGGIDGLSVTASLGVYYSNDSGTTWNRAVIRDGGTPITPASVTSLVYDEGAKTFFAAVRFHGFYSSTKGTLWTRLPNQPGDVQLNASVCPATGSFDCPIYRGELAVVPGRNEIYAWYVDDDDNDMGISRSFDGGNSWQPLVDTAISACGDPAGCGTEDGSYNLTLAATPDGASPGQTDIYAGAVNLYKCRTINRAANCSGTGANTFLNLTHASGCALAGVHPAQHGIDFLQVANNTQALMFFANDGGVYRGLDGYSGLVNGDCLAANNFDNLNQNLGSLAQFVSLAQDPTQANTMLGGAPVVGFPGTAQALSSSGWQSVNSGQGGFTAIDANNPEIWFTENSGVSIQRCPFGIACRSSDFASQQIVTSTTLGGDAGPFYTPFVLDPSPGAMVVGTCRVWRGQSDGSNFVPLSVNFETGGSSGCSGVETNQVRALAAYQVPGGLFPEILYAGTDGFGPLVTSGPMGGHVWVSDPQDPTSWSDQTGTINPGHFPVSAIAIDPFDVQTDPIAGTAGQAAYVALTGYGTGNHVWKTVNGGLTWLAFDGFAPNNLPDVPANALVVDSNAQGGSVYVGTDQGVYVTGTNDPNTTSWLPVGGGVGGKLPNVPVTALQIYNDGATKILRAATYGRGVWQFVLATTPDFQVSIPAPSQTVLVGQIAHFAGKLTALNSYASSVTLSCVVTGGQPQCSPTPSHVSSINATAFDVAASAPLGDYAFKLHALGSDAKAITHDTPLSLHVVDFGVSTPSPAATTVRRGNSTGHFSLSVSASGSFNSAVKLSCVGLPTGASCSFSPSSTVSPVSGSPVAVSFTISTTSAAKIGTAAITVDAAAFSGHKTTSVSLSVVANPDFSLTAVNHSLTANVPDTVTFAVTATAVDGYTTAVNLSCGPGAPPVCSVAPGTLTPTASGVTATVTLQSNQAANYSFTIVAVSTDASPITRTADITFAASAFGFNFAPSSPQTIRAGDKAIYTLTLAPQSPATTFPSAVALSKCTGVPPLSTCTVAPTSVAAGSGSSTITVTVTTTAAVLASRGRSRLVYAFFLPGMALLLPFGAGRIRRYGLCLLGLLAMAVILASCGGGLTGNSGGGGGAGLPGTAPGDYTIGISATPASGAAAQTATMNLKVT
jgi:hypothetical protein